MRAIVLLLAAGSLLAQEMPLERLKREALAARKLPAESESDPSSNLHRALRDWIESRLPADRGQLAVQKNLDAGFEGALHQAGLARSEAPAGDPLEGPRFGYFTVNSTRFPELPDMLLVTAGVSIPCGVDEAVYTYQFDAAGRRRTMEEHPEKGYGNTHIRISDSDSRGRRLMLVERMSQQCASTWMGMTLSVYRVPSAVPERLLSVQHGFWLGNDGPEFILTPQELLVEFLDGSLDADVHNRTKVYRYSFAEGVRRLDPIAFQPQDFVEEWLKRPWSEMETRSKAGTANWHGRLHDASGDYIDVVQCNGLPARWSVGLEVDRIGRKNLDETLALYFVVRQIGEYRYENGIDR